ncbi:unnamed protein product [Rhizophagus irregularis]|nr:unnamed protein product [Rhizophagus irregularis]
MNYVFVSLLLDSLSRTLPVPVKSFRAKGFLSYRRVRSTGRDRRVRTCPGQPKKAADIKNMIKALLHCKMNFVICSLMRLQFFGLWFLFILASVTISPSYASNVTAPQDHQSHNFYKFKIFI